MSSQQTCLLEWRQSLFWLGQGWHNGNWACPESALLFLSTESTHGLRRLFTPSGVWTARTVRRLHLIWRQTLDPRTLFHSKRIHQMRHPGLLWSQSMVQKLCLRKRQLFLLTISKESLSGIQSFHYRLLLFPVQPHLIGWWVRRPTPIGLILSLGDRRLGVWQRPVPIGTGLFHSIPEGLDVCLAHLAQG